MRKSKYKTAGKRNVHQVIAEAALGRALPVGAQIHHVNEDKSDNRRDNLVICPNQKYHKLLHIRMRALSATGNPNWRKCKICRKYSPPEKLTILKNGAVYHAACNRKHAEKYRRRQDKFKAIAAKVRA